MKPLAPRDALALVLGPAWSQNTPRTDEEASVILGATEPRHALRERLASRRAAAEGCVVLEPSPRVTPGEPMPAATMPAAEWREAWRDAEVPALCALRERCEASGARPVVAYSREHAGSVTHRYRVGPNYGTTSGEVAPPSLDAVLRLRAEVEGAEHVPESADGSDEAFWLRVLARANPLPTAGRGWCIELGVREGASAPVVDPAATWQAMREAAPERVYPEPSE